VHLLKSFVQGVLVIENGSSRSIVGPGHCREVRIGAIAAGEHFVAGAHWIEEVDGVASGDAVPGGSDINRDAVVGQDVGGTAYMIPIIKPETDVVQTAVNALHKGNVVWLVTSF
jgi:hypothetical protein